MTPTRALCLAIALVAAGVALAQRPARGVAAERFHEGARLFVAGDTVAAERAVRAGLAAAPGDPALEALLAAIERRPPPQPSGGSGQDERRPARSDDGREENDRANDEQDAPPEQGRESGDGRSESGGSELRPSDRVESPTQAGPQPGAEAGRPRMTRAEAEALLRALGADERRLLRARAGQVEPREVENEW